MAAESIDEYRWHRPRHVSTDLVAHLTGYRQRGVPGVVHRGLPSPYLTLILTLDEPCHVAVHPDRARPAADFVTLVGGLHTRHAVITHDGAQSGVQVALNPLAAPAVLGVPAGELAGLDVNGSEVMGADADRLQERLRAAGEWTTRFALVEAFLTRRLAAADGVDGSWRGHAGRREVAHAWRELRRSGGAIGVRALAREVGYSERRLRELFRREIGLSPKQAARVVRFDAVRRVLPSAAAQTGLTRLAARAGYADQSHLVRDFHDFAGLAPGRWLDEEGLLAGQAPEVDGRFVQAESASLLTGSRA